MQPKRPPAASFDPLSMFDTERRPARVVPGPGATTTATAQRRTVIASEAVAKATVARVTPAAPAPRRPTAVAPAPASKRTSSWINGRGSLWFFASGMAFGSAVAVFVVLRITGSPASAQDPLPSPASSQVGESPLYGSLAIDTSPVVARAYVNGSLVGLTPLVLRQLPVGSRVIRLEANNHAPWISTVRIVADQETRLDVTMSPAH